jgi:hypothetical protein
MEVTNMSYKMSWERDNSSDSKFETIQHGYDFLDEEEEDFDIELDDVEDVEFDLDEWDEM